MPVDLEDDLQRQERVLDRTPEQAAVGERPSLPADPADKGLPPSLDVIDVDLDLIAGNSKPEIELRLE